jgi:hypothetical protein
MLAVGLVQRGRRPEPAMWGVLLLLVAAACYAGGLLASAIGLRRDDAPTYAKAGLVLAIVIAFPLLPVWLQAISRSPRRGSRRVLGLPHSLRQSGRRPRLLLPVSRFSTTSCCCRPPMTGRRRVKAREVPGAGT